MDATAGFSSGTREFQVIGQGARRSQDGTARGPAVVVKNYKERHLLVTAKILVVPVVG